MLNEHQCFTTLLKPAEFVSWSDEIFKTLETLKRFVSNDDVAGKIGDLAIKCKNLNFLDKIILQTVEKMIKISTQKVTGAPEVKNQIPPRLSPSQSHITKRIGELTKLGLLQKQKLPHKGLSLSSEGKLIVSLIEKLEKRRWSGSSAEF